MAVKLDYDLRDALPYIKARVLESQHEYDMLVAKSPSYKSNDDELQPSQSSASVRSSHSGQSHHGSICPYREMIAEPRAETSPDPAHEHLRDDEATSFECASQDSRCCLTDEENTPSISAAMPSKAGQETSSGTEFRLEEIRQPAQHTDPH